MEQILFLILITQTFLVFFKDMSGKRELYEIKEQLKELNKTLKEMLYK